MAAHEDGKDDAPCRIDKGRVGLAENGAGGLCTFTIDVDRLSLAVSHDMMPVSMRRAT
jgi:hypothetical protein